MKKYYISPSIEKMEFNFDERIAFSGGGGGGGCTCGKGGGAGCKCGKGISAV